jgi:hypothetical protein
MNKPVLYLDVVGTLVLDHGQGMELAPFSRKFLNAVKDHFEIRFLTSLEEHQALGVAKALGLDVIYWPYRQALGKGSAIDMSENFFWIEEAPTPADLLRLSDERCSERLIPVTRRDGITEATLRKLMSTLEQVQGMGEAL